MSINFQPFLLVPQVLQVSLTKNNSNRLHQVDGDGLRWKPRKDCTPGDIETCWFDMLVPMQVQIIGCNKASDGDVEAALAQLCADRCLSWKGLWMVFWGVKI